MQTRVSGVILYKNKHHVVDIFGYSTKGIPGIEIVGIRDLKFSIKEKFAFISKTLKLNVPKKRYVMCVDLDESILSKDESAAKWLELPLLLLYWTLGGQLPIYKLDNCFCSGRVSGDGKIECLNLKHDILDIITVKLKQNGDFKYITSSSACISEVFYHLPLERLLSNKHLQIKKRHS